MLLTLHVKQCAQIALRRRVEFISEAAPAEIVSRAQEPGATPDAWVRETDSSAGKKRQAH